MIVTTKMDKIQTDYDYYILKNLITEIEIECQ